MPFHGQHLPGLYKTTVLAGLIWVCTMYAISVRGLYRTASTCTESGRKERGFYDIRCRCSIMLRGVLLKLLLSPVWLLALMGAARRRSFPGEMVLGRAVLMSVVMFARRMLGKCSPSAGTTRMSSLLRRRSCKDLMYHPLVGVDDCLDLRTYLVLWHRQLAAHRWKQGHRTPQRPPDHTWQSCGCCSARKAIQLH